MKKNLTFSLSLTFSQGVSDKDRVEVMQNISDALEYYADTHGVAPQNKGFLTGVRIEDDANRAVKYQKY